MSSAGRSLSRFVTLPLIGAGAASVHFAAEFDQSMRNVNSIMGVSGAELDKYSEKVLDFSTEFPQDAKVLADGLYSIASSGFQGADGLKVLEASARAASAGLTDTQTSAKAITAVLNAYGGSAEDAAHVSDVLFTAVDKGVLSFEEIASTIGDYVGAASQLGVPLEQVAGAQAAMTLSGLSASEAATSLSGIFRSLLKPSDDLSAALQKMGYESGQAALEAEGLDGLMAMIATAVGDNKSKWVELFPEIRAARGAMALAANDGENLTRVMDEMTKASGHTEDAFKEQSKGASFQFTIALNKLKRAGIEIGNELIPIITDHLIPAVQRLLHWWDGLSEGGKELALKIAGITLAAGPLLRILGPLTSGVGRLVGGVGSLAGVFKTAGGGLTGFKALLGSGTLALGAWGVALATAGVAVKKTIDYKNMDNEASKKWIAQIEAGEFSLDELGRAVDDVTDKQNAFLDTLDGDLPVLQAYDATVKALTDRWTTWATQTGASETALAEFLDVMGSADGITDKQAQALAGLVTSLNKTTDGLSDQQAQMVSNLLAVGDFKGAMVLLKGVINDQYEGVKDYNPALDDLSDAHIAAARAARAEWRAEQLLNGVYEQGPGAIEDYVNWVDTLEGALADTARAAYAAYRNQQLLQGGSTGGGGGGGTGGGGGGTGGGDGTGGTGGGGGGTGGHRDAITLTLKNVIDRRSTVRSLDRERALSGR